jgi:hypothetical protein
MGGGGETDDIEAMRPLAASDNQRVFRKRVFLAAPTLDFGGLSNPSGLTGPNCFPVSRIDATRFSAANGFGIKFNFYFPAH